MEAHLFHLNLFLRHLKNLQFTPALHGFGVGRAWFCIYIVVATVCVEKREHTKTCECANENVCGGRISGIVSAVSVYDGGFKGSVCINACLFGDVLSV